MVGRERDRHPTGRCRYVVWYEDTQKCTITNLNKLGERLVYNPNWAYGKASNLLGERAMHVCLGLPQASEARVLEITPRAYHRDPQRTPLNPEQDYAKDDVSHPRWATGLDETAEAERLEMYLRSVWCMQPKTVTWYPLLVFVFDGGIQIRVAWRIGQAHDRALIATTAGSRWCRDVSTMCSVRRNKMKNTRIFHAI